jgi:mannose/fructose/N-acetylgalactosamine-specific phosphotransferase system component IID
MSWTPASVAYLTKSYHESLAPGEAVWKDIESLSPVFGQCAVSVTASAEDGSPGGLLLHVLKVDDINITMVKGVLEYTFTLGFNVINNGSTTITAWNVIVGLIGPDVILGELG